MRGIQISELIEEKSGKRHSFSVVMVHVEYQYQC